MQATQSTNAYNWIFPLAMLAFRHSMSTECDRLNPDYPKPFAERSDAADNQIDFDDPAIKAFCSMVDFPAVGPLTVQSFDHGIKRTGSKLSTEFKSWHRSNQAFQALCTLRPNNGWAQLDKLVGLCSRPRLTWSHFVDSVSLNTNLDDHGVGGDTAYRIMLMTHLNEWVSGVVDWFAAASDVKYLVSLLEKIEDGTYPPVDSHRPGPVLVAEIRLMRNDELMACLPVVDPTSSMRIDWNGFECLSADTAFYFELMKELPPAKSNLVKGKVLVDSIT